MSIYDRLYDVRNYTGMYAERFRDLSAKLSPGGAPGKAQYTGSTNQGTDMKFDSVADFLRPGHRSRTRISDNGRRVPEATTWSPRGMDPIPIPDHPLDTPGKLQYLFNFYCMYGRTGLQRIKTLGEFQYMRFIKHCPGLLCNDKRLMRSAGGGEVLDQTEADLIYVRAKGKCENRLSFDTFMDALQMMAVKKFPIDDAKTALTYLLAKHVLRNENLVKIGQGADSALDVEATYTIADAPLTGSAPAIADAAAPSFGPPTNAIEVEAALQREQKRLVDEVFGPDEGVRKFNEILADPAAYNADKRPYVVRILALCEASRRFAEEEAAAMAAAAGGGADVARIVARTQEREESHRRNLAAVTQQLAQSELQRETLKNSLSRSLEQQARAGSERRALSEQLNETRAALAAMQAQLAQQGGGGGGYAPPSPPSSRSPLRAGASVHIDRNSNIVISPGGARDTARGATRQAAAATPLPGGRAQPAAPLTVRNVRTIAGNGSFIFCIGALSGTGGFLAGSGDHTIYERRADGELAPRPTLKGHASEVYCIIVLPDGTIVSGSSDSTICVWNKNASNGAWAMTDQLLKHSGAVYCLAALQGAAGKVVAGAKRSWSSGASQRCSFASGGEDGTVQLWQNPENGAGSAVAVEQLSGHEGCVYSLTTLHDGTLVSGGQDSSIVMWRNGGCVRVLREHSKEVYCLATLNAVSFASGSGDFTICTWNNDGELLGRLRDHIAPVLALVTMPNGNFASGSSDKVIRIWEDSGNCVAALTGHTDPVSCLACLDDGTLVSGSDDKTIRLWR